MSQFSFCRPVGLLMIFCFALPAAMAGSTSLQANDDTALHHKHHGKTAAAKQSHVPEVKHSLLIKAKPEHVWEAIKHQRKSDGNRKLLSYDGTAATLHETFASLPIVGAASCDYVENESTPLERIDYSMLKSDQFAVFQGSWTLSPGKDANTTMLELSNALDPGIRVPFWQDITKMAASRFVKRRLDAVSAYAEHLQNSEIR